MPSTRVTLTLLVALTLSLVATVTAQPLSGPEYIALTPCRVFDSRSGSPLPGGEVTNVTITGTCGVPVNAVAADLNLTIVAPVAAGHLTVFPTNGTAPVASLVNYVAGQTIANAADIKLGAGGAISAQPLATTNLVIDVYGYFTDVEELAGANTALGLRAMETLTPDGGGNTAMGFQALRFVTTGDANTAVGAGALGGGSPVTGQENVAIGVNALFATMTGRNNVAVGPSALASVTTGSFNIGIGNVGGGYLTSGAGNIYIGHIGSPESSTENSTIRIGYEFDSLLRAFIMGIRGVTTDLDDALPVLIDSAGQLGTTSSSRRVKTDIHDLGDQSRALHQLRPVSFRYRSHPPNSLQYGLIAEEVAEVYPELVVLDKEGQPSGVRYHVLPAMLLNELQRQQRESEARFTAQQREIDELRAQVRALIGAKAAVRE